MVFRGILGRFLQKDARQTCINLNKILEGTEAGHGKVTEATTIVDYKLTGDLRL